MKAKERFNTMKLIFPDVEEEEYIREVVNTLIDALYIPSEKDIRALDRSRLELFNIDFDEPVNWGAVGCYDVRIFKELVEVILDEACPSECPTLCDYIEKHLGFQGYSNVLVRTEW